MPGSVEFFSRFPNSVFVETGTFLGGGVDNALKAGFNMVYSIELDDALHLKAKEILAGNDKVTLVLGDSGAVLGDVIAPIQKPITFWLDGHYSTRGTAKGPDMSPILRELAHIKSHPIKTHTILIDDTRLMGGVMFDFMPIGKVCEMLWTINPEYRLSLQTADGCLPNDILVAQVL